MWGMMLGFSGINYTAWLYLAWLPGYLQTAYNLDLKVPDLWPQFLSCLVPPVC